MLSSNETHSVLLCTSKQLDRLCEIIGISSPNFLPLPPNLVNHIISYLFDLQTNFLEGKRLRVLRLSQFLMHSCSGMATRIFSSFHLNVLYYSTLKQEFLRRLGVTYRCYHEALPFFLHFWTVLRSALGLLRSCSCGPVCGAEN